MKKAIILFGTRPEAIKLAPLIIRLRSSTKISSIVCSTGQHREMLHQVLEFFGLTLDYDLNLMKSNQKLHELTANILMELEPLFEEVKPDIVIVQGDTTSCFAGALSAFYNKIKIAHIEAGLRSNNRYSPFPEEINRILTTHLSDYHFAPTIKARDWLINEGIDDKRVFVVGNTVIDALLMGLEKIQGLGPDHFMHNFNEIDFSKRVILVTGHRRESFGKPFQDICEALKKIANEDRVEIVYPVHLNPNVRAPVFSILGDKKNIHLINPVTYQAMVYLMNNAYIILTDSGGIQEEAPSLKKPVLVMREVTERTEGIEAGVTKIVGTNIKRIVDETRKLLNNRLYYESMATGQNPYGDGNSSIRIVELLENILLED